MRGLPETNESIGILIVRTFEDKLKITYVVQTRSKLYI